MQSLEFNGNDGCERTSLSMAAEHQVAGINMALNIAAEHQVAGIKMALNIAAEHQVAGINMALNIAAEHQFAGLNMALNIAAEHQVAGLNMAADTWALGGRPKHDSRHVDRLTNTINARSLKATDYNTVCLNHDRSQK